jgi:hypothetical protein
MAEQGARDGEWSRICGKSGGRGSGGLLVGCWWTSSGLVLGVNNCWIAGGMLVGVEIPPVDVVVEV